MPPRTVLKEWLKVFGGDLLAFSAAVVCRMSDPSDGTWKLEAGDAAKYVRDTYLKPASKEEREALLRLAALAELELAASDKAVAARDLEKFIDMGLVLRTEQGERRDEFFSLVHPGFGDLIWLAADETRHRASLRFEIAQSDMNLAIAIVFQLRRIRRRKEITSILHALAEQQADLVRPLLARGLLVTRDFARLFAEYDVISELEFGKQLCQDRDQLMESAFCTGANGLLWFLVYAREHIPEVHSALAGVLAEKSNRDRLIACGFPRKSQSIKPFSSACA